MPRLTASSVNSLGVQSLIGRPLEAGKTHRQGDDLDNLLHGEFRLRPRSEFIAQHGYKELTQTCQTVFLDSPLRTKSFSWTV